VKAETLREILKRNPFQPFSVRMGSGDVVPVRHPEFAFLTPSGRTLYVVLQGADAPESDEYTKILDVVLIEGIDAPANGSSNGGAA
jgi:hypothetical protein